jgi:hypothetical protein
MNAMDRPRLYIDFNEMLESDLYLLSKADIKIDSSGNAITLHEGMRVHVYMDDADASGQPDNVIADGTVERNSMGGWAAQVKWCCRIDAHGFRHESDERRA